MIQPLSLAAHSMGSNMVAPAGTVGANAAAQGFAPAGTEGAEGTSFKDMLLNSIKQVSAMQQDADKAVAGLMTGEEINPTEVLTAVQKADMAFRLMMQVRNKLVQAYNEVQNIRV